MRRKTAMRRRQVCDGEQGRGQGEDGDWESLGM